MADSFDVKNFTVFFGTSVGANVPLPLFHVPTSAGAQTVVEAFFNACTIGTLGTIWLITGTADDGGSLGTAASCSTIGTVLGTGAGGGTFGAGTLEKFSLASPAIIPAGYWLGIMSNLAWNAIGNNEVTVAYVSGR